jgi:cytochrome P450
MSVFGSYVLKYNDEQGMNTQEIVSSSRVIIAAGSETTATALSGLIYYLLTTPHTLPLLVKEIRSSFKGVEEMTFANEAKLSYLQACVEEVLRVYPPVAMELSRLTPREGCFIDGVFIPGNVSSLPNKRGMKRVQLTETDLGSSTTHQHFPIHAKLHRSPFLRP